jgi:hypothetical protein
MELWWAVRTQWRCTAFGPVGLDYLAVDLMARHLDIDLSPCMMMKIKALEAHTLESLPDAKRNDTRGTEAGSGPEGGS